jgi:hypothetical protein
MTRLPLLCMLAAMLGGVVAFELLGMPRSHAVAAPLSVQAVNAPPALPTAGHIAVESGPDRTGIILARPLMSLTRRPGAKAAPDKDETTLSSLPRITGIVVMPTHKSVIFAAVGENKPAVAGEGGHVGVFLIQSIEPGNVTVSGPDGSRLLHPSFSIGTLNPALTR